MMQFIIVTRRKPLRHWLNALAIAGTDQTHVTEKLIWESLTGYP